MSLFTSLPVLSPPLNLSLLLPLPPPLVLSCWQLLSSDLTAVSPFLRVLFLSLSLSLRALVRPTGEEERIETDAHAHELGERVGDPFHLHAEDEKKPLFFLSSPASTSKQRDSKSNSTRQTAQQCSITSSSEMLSHTSSH